jgi:hypothetical protein
MSWRREWDGISARIAGFLDAGRFYIETLGINRSDETRVGDKLLIPQSTEILASLTTFRERNATILPDVASAALNSFLDASGQFIGASHAKGHFGVQGGITALVAFRAEFEYLIRDASVTARRQSERAFEHLQRSIVADSIIGATWLKAFHTRGETACERLGAAHLLSHGIWAFKVNAAGERTDLVFAERPVAEDEVTRVADALVLTEWKVVRTRADLDPQIDQARKQADRYKRGALGGIELASYRYLVVVSRDFLTMPEDLRDETTVYRHINIAVNPRVPSA